MASKRRGGGAGGEADRRRLHPIELQLQNEELREAHAELAKARDRYFELFELAPVGYLTLDEQGRIRECNLTAANSIGLERSRIVGAHLQRWLSEADADRFAVASRRLVRSTRPIDLEVALQRADGVRLPTLITAAAAPGQPGVLRVVLFDRSEREQLLADLAETIDDVFYLAEPGGELIYLSPAFERRFGRRLEPRSADGWLARVHRDDRERVRRARGQIGREAAIDFEYRMLDTAGQPILVRERAFCRADGRVAGIVHDVTDERRAEAEARQGQRMQAVGTLASGIAHDVNNLLMGIAGMAELALRRLPKDHGAVEVLARIKDACLRGSNLSKQLVDFAAGRRRRVEPTSIDDVLRESREMIARLVGGHIAVELTLGAPGALVSAEQGDIRQILLNLAGNARDAMAEGGRLSIRTEVHGDRLELRIGDTGAGMDEQTRAHIFEPFFTTKEVGKGTGLGLSMVFGVCQRLGGKIEVESAPGCGTTFTLRFPLAAALAAARRPPLPEPKPCPRNGRALVVDDEPAVLESVLGYLDGLGWIARGARGADEARAKFERERFDALLVDVMMPGTMGDALAAELAARDAGVAVVLMSAHPRAELARQVRLPAGAAVLEKPFDQAALASALGEVIAARLDVERKNHAPDGRGAGS